MDTLKNQIAALPTDEWETLLGWVVGEEKTRRDAAPLVEAGRVEVVDELRESGVMDTPADAPPAGTPLADALATISPHELRGDLWYRRGDRVREGNHVYEFVNPAPGNWRPSEVDGRIWRDVTDEYVVPAPDPEDPEVEPDTPPAEDAPPATVPAYSVGTAYVPGDRFTDGGVTYEVLQTHVSAAHWPPSASHSLYKVVTA